MAYSKPVIVAQNSSEGSFAAGCPEKSKPMNLCAKCELKA